MIIALLVVMNVYLILSFLLGEMGLLNANTLRKTNLEMHKEVAEMEAENEGLARKINALRTDADTIERLAREELGLVKEGELVYEFFETGRL